MAARQSYFHTNTLHEANTKDTSVPLILNCAGVEYYHAPFRSKPSPRHDYSLLYVINGSLDFWSGEDRLSITAGCFAIIPPHITLQFGTDRSFLNYYWLNYTGALAENVGKDVCLEPYKVYNIGMCEDIREQYKKIFNEFLINDKLFPTVSGARLMELMVALSRKTTSGEKPYLQSVEYIHKHYNEDISVKQLSAMESISPSYYRRVFKDKMGISPQDYITNQRINAACFYLVGSRSSVEEISALVGYQDQFYFSRIFKKNTGFSPQQYRKANKEGLL